MVSKRNTLKSIVFGFMLGVLACYFLRKQTQEMAMKDDISVTISENENVSGEVLLPISQTSIDAEVDTEELSENDTSLILENSPASAGGFYLNLSQYVLWESGEYSIETGEKTENRRRMRYPRIIENEGYEYYVTISEGYSLNIAEYSEDKRYLGVTVISCGEVYQPSEKVRYFCITLFANESEKTYSPGQWNRCIGKYVEIVIYTESLKDYSVKNLGLLIEQDGSDGHSLDEMRNILLDGEDDILSGIIWSKQVSNGVYSLTGEELDNGNITYFVSSSEGDDRNTGLDMNHPKKSLDYFSGFSNVNVLLKCGDTFDVSGGIIVGDNCIYAAYGRGQRPILDFYRKLNTIFEKDSRRDCLWVADLSEMDICDGSETKDNCNIGQLVINGDINLKRCVWPSADKFDPDTVVKYKDNAWAVDWVDSKLYIYNEDNPNNVEILFAPPTNALTLNGSKNVVIKGLEIKGVGRHAISMTDTQNILISCCYLNHIGGSVLQKAGVRFGNGVQVWNSGSNIIVENNYLSWIFDTCFTHQGSSMESMVEHLYVRNNIGAHFFWGIEVWGDSYSNNGFKDVVYSENILFDNVDVTNPKTPMHSGPNTRLLGGGEAECISYRNGYFYHQMSSFNVSNAGKGDVTRIEKNVAWNSNRFLILASDSRDELVFSPFKNNLLYAEVEEEDACMMRFQKAGVKIYCREMDYLDSSNTWSIHIKGDEYKPTDEGKRIEALLKLMVEK